jgi:PAS domain S-box-containing protein
LEKSIDREFLASLVDSEALYQHAPCGYISFLPDGTIIKINETLLNWLGNQNDEIVYRKRFGELISKGGEMYYALFYLPLLQLNTQVNEVNFEVKRQDNSIFPALLNAIALKDEDGQIIAINATIYNISDRKKYETELLETKVAADSEREKFEFLSDFIPDMIWMADDEGRINYANKRLLTYFDITREALNKENIHAQIHPEDIEKYVDLWNISVKTGEDFQTRLRVRNKTNKFKWYLVKAVRYSEKGNVIKWLGSYTDIDEHVKELSRRDDFLSIASHELKTPLTTLKSGLQLLNRIKDQPNSPVHIKLIDQSMRSMEKIHKLVDDLLNVKRLKEGYLQLNKTSFDVAAMLESSCAHIRLNDKYELMCHGEKPVMIVADEHQIEQVVENFVNNAVKYAAGSRDIKLSWERAGNFVKVSVKDNGAGIEKQKLPFLFDRYYRVDHSSKDYSGLGLGLYICAEIIKRHKGTIGVDSEKGEGSTFWFTLPLKAELAANR